DQLYLADANLLVHARAVLLNGQRNLHRATNGANLLGCCNAPPAAIEASAAMECLWRLERRSGETAQKSTSFRAPNLTAQARTSGKAARTRWASAACIADAVDDL